MDGSGSVEDIPKRQTYSLLRINFKKHGKITDSMQSQVLVIVDKHI